MRRASLWFDWTKVPDQRKLANSKLDRIKSNARIARRALCYIGWVLFHKPGAHMKDCLFCKIITGEIPSKKVYEDDQVFVFEDINPVAPTHVLIVPKRHVADLKSATAADAELLGYCQLIAAKIGRERKIEDGYRTVYNVGPREPGQTGAGRFPEADFAEAQYSCSSASLVA
jgi:histidine triad (HIT) family protein